MIDSKNNTDCHIKDLSGPEPAFWDWLASAKYLGQRNVREYGLLDVWNYVVANVNLTLAVRNTDVNTPLFLAREVGALSLQVDESSLSCLAQTSSMTSSVLMLLCQRPRTLTFPRSVFNLRACERSHHQYCLFEKKLGQEQCSCA